MNSQFTNTIGIYCTTGYKCDEKRTNLKFAVKSKK